MLKDFVSVAGLLNVTHFIMLSKTEISTSLRIARLPRGPTLSFKVQSYSLARDVISSLKRHAMEQKQFSHHPLLVMNGFSGDKHHLKLMTTMFQNMFPSININKVKYFGIGVRWKLTKLDCICIAHCPDILWLHPLFSPSIHYTSTPCIMYY